MVVEAASGNVVDLDIPTWRAGHRGWNMANEKEPFNVVLFGGSGPEKIFQSYPAK